MVIWLKNKACLAKRHILAGQLSGRNCYDVIILITWRDLDRITYFIEALVSDVIWFTWLEIFSIVCIIVPGAGFGASELVGMLAVKELKTKKSSYCVGSKSGNFALFDQKVVKMTNKEVSNVPLFNGFLKYGEISLLFLRNRTSRLSKKWRVFNNPK